MLLQIAVLGKAKAAVYVGAGERFLTSVRPHVVVQLTLILNQVITDCVALLVLALEVSEVHGF